MAAVISGLGLGLFNSSLSNGVGSFGQASHGQAKEQIYVNAATGNLVVQGADETVLGLGAAFGLVRTYNSTAGADGDNNDQWRMGYISSVLQEGAINAAGSRVIRTTGDGYQQEFDYVGGKYISKAGADSFDTLEYISGKAVVTSENGLTEHYNSNNMLVERRDADGSVSIDYAAGKPSQIRLKKSDGSEDITSITYHANGLLKGVKTSAANGSQELVSYGYDALSRLTSVTIDKTPETTADNANTSNIYEIKYTYYDTTNRLKTISQTDGSALTIEYYGDGRVKNLTNGENVKTTYEYVNANQSRVTVGGQSTNYYFDNEERLLKVARPVSGTLTIETSYTYSVTNGKLETITDGEGGITRFDYDSRGNLQKQTDANLNSIERQFNVNNMLELETVDGKTTRYVYDATGYLVRFIIGHDGAVTEISYNSQHLKNQLSRYTNAVFNLSGFGSKQVPTLANMTAWQIQADKSKQLTEYVYDWRGQLSEVKEYDAVSSSGAGVGQASIQSFTYNFRGQLIQQTSPRGSATVGNDTDYRKTFIYDGLGRLIQQTDEANNSTIYEFNDASKTQVVKFANGLWQAKTLDNTGLVVNLQQGSVDDLDQLNSETYKYDNQGRLVASKDVYGGWAFWIYDNAGRLAAEVDRRGAVVRHEYDKADRLIKTIQYSNLLTSVNRSGWIVTAAEEVTVNLATLNTLLATSSFTGDTEQRIAQYIFDAAGQKAYEIDGEGWISKFSYSAAGQLQSVSKATQSLGKLSWSSAPAASGLNKADLDASNAVFVQLTEYQYDANGQLQWLTQWSDASKFYKTLYSYDKAGNKVSERQFNTVNSDVQSADDKVSHWIYNAKGKVSASITADGAVSSYSYNLDGQLQSRVDYEKTIRNYVAGQTLILPTGNKRTTTYQYNDRGALESEASAEGIFTFYRYDAMGQVIEKWQGQQNSTATGVKTDQDYKLERMQYDLLGRKTAVLDGNRNQSLGAAASVAEVDAAFATLPSQRNVYDTFGNITESFDAEGNQTLFYYGANGELLTTIDAAGQIIRYSYSAFGELVKTTEIIKAATDEYLLKLQEQRLIAGNSSHYQGNNSYLTGTVIAKSVNSSDDKVTEVTFDNAGQRLSLKNALNITDLFSYNFLGQQVTQVSSKNAPWSTTSKQFTSITRTDTQSYDLRGLTTNVSTGTIVTNTTQEFDAFGRLVKSTDPQLNTTFYDYKLPNGVSDNIGRVLVNYLGNERKLTTYYDAFGRMLKTIDALNNETDYSYNEQQRTMTVRSPDGVITTTKRDTLGRIARIEISQDAVVLQATEYKYDANGNLLETWLDGQLQQQQTYTKTNLVKTQTDATGTVVTLKYDGIGRVQLKTVQIDGKAVSTSWVYKARGSVVEQMIDGQTVTSRYDKIGRLVAVEKVETLSSGAQQVVATEYTYSRSGQVLRSKVGVIYSLAANNVRGAEDLSQAVVTQYDYDILDRLIRSYTLELPSPLLPVANDNIKNAIQIKVVSFAYDGNNNLVEKLENPGATNFRRTIFQYNNANQITTEITIVDNLHAGGKGRASVKTFEYDANGRQIAEHRYLNHLLLDSAATATDIIVTTAPSSGSSAVATRRKAITDKVDAAFLNSAKASSYTAYNETGQRIATIDATGSRNFLRYDALGRVAEEIRLGTVQPLSADEITLVKTGDLIIPTFANVVATSDVDARSSYLYNAQGKVLFKLTSTGTHASVVGYQYDAEGKMIASRQYANQVVYRNDYTETTLTTALTPQALDRTSQTFYDSNDRVRFTIDGAGLVTEFQYDDKGQLLATIIRSKLINSTSDGRAKWLAGSLSYADLQDLYVSNILQSADRKTETRFDDLGRVKQIIYAEKNPSTNQFYTEFFSYNAAGLKQSFTDKNGQVWTYQYDAVGRLVAEYTPLLTSEHKVSLLIGNEYQDVSGYGKKLYNYDGLGNLLTIEEGVVANITDLAFTGQSRTTSFEYDLAGRQTKIIPPIAEHVPAVYSTTTYNALGQAVVSQTFADDVLKNVSYKVYNSAGLVLYEVEAKTFNNVLQPLTGQVTSYQYNSFGQVTLLTRHDKDVDLTSTSALTQSALEAQFYTNPYNRTIETRYDNAGRKISVLETARQYSWFDATSNSVKTSATNVQPQTSFTYNSFGEVFKTSVKTGNGTETLDSFSWYDNMGRKTHTVDAAGYVSEWTYTATGEIYSYTEYAHSIATTGLQQQTKPVIPSVGNATIGNNRRWEYGYDLLGRQITETQTGVVAYQNNDPDQIVLVTTKSQKYDGLGRVVSTTNSDGITALQYDVVGNLRQTNGRSTAVLADQSQLTPHSTLTAQSSSQLLKTSFKYDIFGNTVEIRQHANENLVSDKSDLVSRFIYNQRDQAIEQLEIWHNNDLVATEKKTKFYYDEHGKLIKSELDYQEPLQSSSLVTELYGKRTVMRFIRGEPEAQLVTTSIGAWVKFDLVTGKITGKALTTIHYEEIGITVLDKDGVKKTYLLNNVHFTQGQEFNLSVPGYIAAPAAVQERQIVQTYSYDKNGNKTSSSTVLHDLTAGTSRKEQHDLFYYNNFGDVVKQSSKNSAGVEQTLAMYIYDTSGHLIQTNEGDNALKTNLYDLAGRLIQNDHALNGKTIFVLDKLGRQQLVRQPSIIQNGQELKIEVHQQFDRWGNVTQLTDARGFEYRYQYNHQNKVTTEFKPQTLAVEEDGSQDKLVPTTVFRYDQQGRLLKSTDANGHSKTMGYDGNGQLLVETDAEGNKSYIGYDIFGRQVAQQDALGLIQYSNFNQIGLITETGQLAKGINGGTERLPQFIYEYNSVGQRISSTDALGNKFHYRYDARNNLVLSLSPSSVRKTYQFDEQGRKTLETYARIGDPEQVQSSWNYSVQGQQTDHKDLEGKATTITYRQASSLNDFGWVMPLNSTVVEAISDDYGRNIQYSYYENGWLKSVTDVASGIKSEYRYNANGQRVWELHKAKDLKGNAIVQRVETVYDEHGRVIKIEVWDQENNAATLLTKVSYRYDAVGNRRSLRVANSFDGVIQQVEVSPTPNLVTIPVKSGGPFKTTEYAIETLFVSDEKDQLKFELDASAPAWLKLEFNPDGSFFLSNKPGFQSPLFNNNEIIKVKFVARTISSNAIVASKTIDLKLVLSTNLELSGKAYTNKVISWPTLASSEFNEVKFADHFQDLDGDEISFGLSPKFEQFIDGNWVDKTGSLSTYLLWDVKTGSLKFSNELVNIVGNQNYLQLRVSLEAKSLDTTNNLKSLLHKVVFEFKPVEVWQGPVIPPVITMLTDWHAKGSGQIVLATLASDFITNDDGRVVVEKSAGVTSKVELTGSAQDWLKLEWNSVTHTGKIITVGELSPTIPDTIMIRVYDHLSETGYVEKPFAITKVPSPVTVSTLLPDNKKLSIELGEPVDINLSRLVSLKPTPDVRPITYGLTIQLTDANGNSVVETNPGSQSLSGLVFDTVTGRLTGKIPENYKPGLALFTFDVYYTWQGVTFRNNPVSNNNITPLPVQIVSNQNLIYKPTSPLATGLTVVRGVPYQAEFILAEHILFQSQTHEFVPVNAVMENSSSWLSASIIKKSVPGYEEMQDVLVVTSSGENVPLFAEIDDHVLVNYKNLTTQESIPLPQTKVTFINGLLPGVNLDHALSVLSSNNKPLRVDQFFQSYDVHDLFVDPQNLPITIKLSGESTSQTNELLKHLKVQQLNGRWHLVATTKPLPVNLANEYNLILTAENGLPGAGNGDNNEPPAIGPEQLKPRNILSFKFRFTENQGPVIRDGDPQKIMGNVILKPGYQATWVYDIQQAYRDPEGKQVLLVADSVKVEPGIAADGWLSVTQTKAANGNDIITVATTRAPTNAEIIKSYSITFDVKDQDGVVKTNAFTKTFKLEELPPIQIKPLGPLSIYGLSPLVINLNDYFEGQNGRDLIYTTISTVKIPKDNDIGYAPEPNGAYYTIEGSILTITPRNDDNSSLMSTTQMLDNIDVVSASTVALYSIDVNFFVSDNFLNLGAVEINEVASFYPALVIESPVMGAQNFTINENDNVSAKNLQVIAQTKNNGKLEYKKPQGANWPDWLNIDSSTGKFTGSAVPYSAHMSTGVNGQETTYHIMVEVVEVVDGVRSPATMAQMNFKVQNLNRQLIVNPISRQTATASTSFIFDVSPYVFDADTATGASSIKPEYSMSVSKNGAGVYSGLSIHPTTGRISGLVSALSGGIYTVSLRVDDKESASPTLIQFELEIIAIEPLNIKILNGLPSTINEQQYLDFTIELTGGKPPFTKPTLDATSVGTAVFISTGNPRVWNVRWTPDSLVGSGNHWNVQEQAFRIKSNDVDNRLATKPISIVVRNVPTPWQPPVLPPIYTIVGYHGANSGPGFSYTLPTDFLRAPDGNYAVANINNTGGEILIHNKPSWVNWDSNTLTLSGLPPPELRGDNVVTFKVSDGAHPAKFASITLKLNVVTIVATNPNLQFVAGAYQNFVIPTALGITKSLPTGVSDGGHGLTLKFTTSSGVKNYFEVGLSFDSATGRISGTLSSEVTGLNNMAFDVYYYFNGHGYGTYFAPGYNLNPINVTVTKANTAPTGSNVFRNSDGGGNRYVAGAAAPAGFTNGVSIELLQYFNDADGDALRINNVSGLPAFLSWDGASRIKGPAPNLMGGTYNIQVQATDDKGGYKIITVTVQIVAPPASTQAVRSIQTTAGRQQMFSLTNWFQDSDPGDRLSYQIMNNLNDVSVSGNYLVIDMPMATNKSFTVRATDSTGLYADVTVQLKTVWDGQPQFVPISPVSAFEAEFQSDNNFVVDSSAVLASEMAAFNNVTAAPEYPEPTDPIPSSPVYAKSKTYWYSYDSNNRVKIDGGSFKDGTISIAEQGSQIFYNAIGQQSFVVEFNGHAAQKFIYDNRNNLSGVQQLADAKKANLLTQPGNLYATTMDWRNYASYQYDSVGRLTTTYRYADKVIHVPVSGGNNYPQAMASSGAGGSIAVDVRGALISTQISSYNADGEVVSVIETGLGNGRTIENVVNNKYGHFLDEYPDDGYVREDSITTLASVSVKETVTSYQNFNAGGLAKTFSYIRYKADGITQDVSHSYVKDYQLRESWLEKSVSGTGTASSGKVLPGNTFSTYDYNGNRVLVEEQSQLDLTKITARQMIYAADGTLLQKRDGTQTALRKNTSQTGFLQQGVAHHFTSNGNYLGEIAKNKQGAVSSTLKDQHFSLPSANNDSNVIKYQLRSGDTLKSLALAFYGNSDYWYLIANVNGLTSSPDESLTEGLAIDIPARASSSNTSNSFKPMDLQKIIGDTTPTLPYVPPPPAAGCNALAMVVMIAITVIATVATAGAAAAAMSTASSSLMSLGTAAIAGGTAAGVSVGVGAGAFVGMSAFAVSATAAAVGGFVGSVAGQLAGKAMGVVDSFSLKNALASGLTAGATAGLGNLMGVGSEVAKGTFSGIAANAKAGATATLNLAGKMAMAASAVGFNVAANKLVGNNQASFQWRNVVTAAATAGAMHSMGITDTESNWGKASSNLDFGGDVLNGFAGAAVGYGVGKGLYNEGSWNFRNVATDVFGNALGNSIVSGLSTKQTEKQAERKGNEAFEKAKAAGMTDTQASKVATEEMLSMLPPDKRRQLLVDNDGERLSINFAGENGKVDRNQGGLSMSLAGDDFRSRHTSLVDFISDEGLWGNNQMLGLATGLLDKRAAYYSYDSIAKRGQQSFDEGYNRGFVNSVRPGVRAQQRQFVNNSAVLNKQMMQLPHEKMMRMGAVETVFQWAKGDGGHIYFQEDSYMSKTFSEGRGAKLLEERFYAKFKDNPPNYGKMTEVDYEYGWISTRWMNFNPAEQAVGTWKGFAYREDNRIIFKAENTMSFSSLAFGNVRTEIAGYTGWEWIRPSESPSDLKTTIYWTKPLK